jgi:hypothetical protein
LTAGSDDEKLQKGIGGIKYGAFALIGIWVAWIFLSILFRLVNLVTTDV